MTVQDKYESVRSLLSEHNEAVGGQGQPGYVDPEAFFSSLKVLGATTEDRLKSLSHEDILDVLPSFNNVKPKVLAKEIAKIFRGKEDVVAAEKRPISGLRADRMTLRELVENFDPENHENAIGKHLASYAKGQPFIVFEAGRTVDVEATIKLLQEVKQGYQGRSDYSVNGVVKRVYSIGELPDNYADENPCYHNRPLRPDGTCDQTGRSWEGVSLEVRQLIRIAIDLGEIDLTIDKAHDLLDIALSADAAKKLRDRYRKASVRFDELATTGKLPLLKIALGGSKGKNPFDKAGAKVEWQASSDNSYRATSPRINQAKSWGKYTPSHSGDGQYFADGMWHNANGINR
jgi:hypothetical protein